MSDFDVLGTVGKLALPTLCKVPDSRKSELGLVRYGSATRGHRSVFGPFEGSFPIRIPARPDKSWRSESSTSCMSVSSFQRTRACGSTCCESGRLCAQAWQRRYRPCTEASLGSQDMILRTEAVGTFLMPRVLTITSSFLVRFGPVKYRIEALITFFRMVKGAVSSIQFSVWSTVRSNLGQTWSTLVKLWSNFGQNSPNSWEMYPEPRFEGFWARDGPQSGWERLGQTLVKLRSTLVKLGQPWSNLVKPWEMCPGPFLGVFDASQASLDHTGWFRAVPVLRADTRENPVGTVRNPPQFACHSLSDALALNRLTHGSDLALRKSVRPSESQTGDESAWVSSPGLETKFVIRVRIGLVHPVPRNGDESGTNRPGPPRSRNEICDSGPNRSGPPSPRNGDESGTNRSGPPRPGFGNSSKRSGTNWDLTLSRIAIGPGFGNSSKRSGTNWDLTLSRIAIGCLTEAVVAEIIAGPHVLGFLCHASFIEVVVALFVGSECTCIPYFRLSYLIVLTTCFWSLAHLVGLSNALDHSCGTTRSMVRPMDKPKGLSHVFPNSGSHFFLRNLSRMAIQNSLIPGLRYYHRFGRFCKEVSIRLDDVDLQ
uniref:Uncharacterized protein n=1 Tax=Fagus sylvatica TaxID=28930 RepID=A0A2N9G9K7_FAGSY